MDIFVGNLSWGATSEEVQTAFEEYGRVQSVRLMKEPDSGRARGFGFVAMPEDSEATAAIEGLDGKEFKGRVLRVDEARSRAGRNG
jgi:RNA recognition motif-containing protein